MWCIASWEFQRTLHYKEFEEQYVFGTKMEPMSKKMAFTRNVMNTILKISSNSSEKKIWQHELFAVIISSVLLLQTPYQLIVTSNSLLIPLNNVKAPSDYNLRHYIILSTGFRKMDRKNSMKWIPPKKVWITLKPNLPHILRICLFYSNCEQEIFIFISIYSDILFQTLIQLKRKQRWIEWIQKSYDKI